MMGYFGVIVIIFHATHILRAHEQPLGRTEVRLSILETLIKDQTLKIQKQARYTRSLQTLLRKQKDKIQTLTNKLKDIQSKCDFNIDQLLYSTTKKTHINYATSLTTKQVDGTNMNAEQQLKIQRSKNDKRRSIDQSLRVADTSTPQTAFYAYMNRTQKTPGKKRTLIFEIAKTNVNNGYNIYSGIFTAPSNGVYVITFTVRMSCHSSGAFEIVKNSDVAGSFYNEHNDACESDTVTGLVVLSANIGDVMFVRTHQTNIFAGNIDSDSVGRSTFSGWAI